MVLLQHHDDAEDHGRGADDGGADEHGLGGGLEGVAGSIAFLELMFGAHEVGAEPEVSLQFRLDTGQPLDLREFVDRLGVVRHRAKGVDRDGHRPHAQEAEGDEAEGEDRRGEGELRRHQADDGGMPREQVGAEHQAQDAEAGPKGGEVAGDQAREDVERGAALTRGRDDLLHVAALRRGEDLGEFGDQGSGQGAQRDDRRQHPPEAAALRREQEVAGEVGDCDRDHGTDPDQVRERLFEVEVLGLAPDRPADGVVQPVAQQGGEDHQDAHGEQPDDERRAERGLGGEGQGEERDQRHAGHAVGLEPVGGRADGVARVVARAVGDHAGVARVVFRQFEDDLHQVGPDVGDLGEDAAADAQRRGAERLTDGEADEARPGQVLG